jgi:hypothetical protein
VVGDVAGPVKTRGTYGIRKLFDRCGIVAPDFTGGPKDEWVRNTFLALSPEEFLAVLGRILSSEENGSEDKRRAVFDTFNSALLEYGVQLSANENQQITIVSVDARLQGVQQGRRSANGLVDPDFEKLDITEDEALRLTITWDEAVKCFGAGAYLAAMIMLGSLLEAVLLLAFQRNRETIKSAGVAFADNKNQEKPIEKWSLGEMIQAAAKLGWTTQKLTSFAHSLREYRNYVHPELRHRLSELPKSHECLIGSLVVTGAVDDLCKAINHKN